VSRALRVLLVSVRDRNILLFRRQLILALQEQGAEVQVCVPKGECAGQLRALGVRLLPFPLQRGSLRPDRLYRAVRGVRHAVRQGAPDVVHSFTHQANVIAGLALAMPLSLRRGPRVLVQTVSGLGAVYIHTNLRNQVLRRLVRWAYCLRFSGARALVFQNPDDLALFQWLGLPASAETLCIRGSGVDLQRFRPDVLTIAQREEKRRELGIGHEHVLVTMAARLLRDKGVLEFAAATGSLATRCPEALFLLAGAEDSGNPAALRPGELAGPRQIPNLRLTGWREDMPAIWNCSDVAVLPSYREGLPVSLQEAMACGLPVLATDVPGCREAVEHGATGLLTPQKDAAALAAAMEELITDRDKRRAMGRAGRVKACREFDGARIALEHIALYERLLADA
jgi:glycosyltransferase involved in cell wall biosynthesis